MPFVDFAAFSGQGAIPYRRCLCLVHISPRALASAPLPLRRGLLRKVSRFGSIPKPTVTVRMKENATGMAAMRAVAFRSERLPVCWPHGLSCALIQVCLLYTSDAADE